MTWDEFCRELIHDPCVGADVAGAEAEAREWLQGGAQAGDWQSQYALMLVRDGGLSLREAMQWAAKADRTEYAQYSSQQLSRKAGKGFVAPLPTYMPAPRFPDGLKVLGASGTVPAQFMVGADGVPINV